jgi:hypothetical protein
MRSKGFSVSEILAALRTMNQERCQPPLGNDELEKIAASMGRYPAGTAVPSSKQQQRPFDPSKLKITRMNTVQPEPIVWLWKGRLPLGKFVLLQGDPGLGKSLVSTDIAARVSTGRAMPDEPPDTVHEPRDVVLLVNEDDLPSTIRPRLDVAGADLQRIHVVEGEYDDDNNLMPLNLGQYTQLRSALQTTDAAVLIIDPLFGHLPSGVGISREEEIRHLLAPLVSLVTELGVVLIGIRHLNQAVELPSQYRGLGAGAWTAQARSELSVMVDPTSDVGKKRFVLGRSKGNLGIEPPVLSYTLEAETDDGAPRVVWGDEPASQSWEEMVRQAATAKKGDSAVGKAEAAVLRVISNAGVDGITWADAMEQLEQLGHSEHTARRARAALAPEVVSRKVRGDDGQLQTRWYLLEHAQSINKNNQTIDQLLSEVGQIGEDTPAPESSSDTPDDNLPDNFPNAPTAPQVGQVGQVDEDTPAPESSSDTPDDNLPNLPSNPSRADDGQVDGQGPKKPKKSRPEWPDEETL